MKTMFSTADVRPGDRFDYWREAVCDSYVMLDCETGAPDAFDGTIDLKRFPRIALSTVGGSNQTVTRRRRDIARSAQECFLVSVQLKETGTVAQDGRTAILHPGDMALYSSARRYQLRLPDRFGQLVLQVPQGELLSRLPEAEQLTGRAIPGASPYAALVRTMAPQLAAAMDADADGPPASAQSALIDLIVSALAQPSGRSHELSHPHEQTLLRADRAIVENLADPALDRERVARAAGVSVRRLNELYRLKDTSAARRIAALRLERIALDLADPACARLSVSEIAFRWGVSNLQSFSRTFRQHHGLSPRDYRGRIGFR